jgi:hypothetical protein
LLPVGGLFLPAGRRDNPLDGFEEKARRKLVKAGCPAVTLQQIVSWMHETFSSPEDRAGKLLEVATFAKTIGNRAARDYFRAIEETNAVAELTDPKVLTFARSVDPHTAEWYFWALWGTKAVRELTDPRVLDAAEFFRSIGGPATVEYFLSIRETKAAQELTDPKVMAFAHAIGSDAATEYFGSFWETNAIGELTSERVLSLASFLTGDVAKEYFLAMRETKAVTELTDPRVLGFARIMGNRVAEDYFWAVRTSRSVTELTSDRVTVFAEVIGKACAREYFRVIASTKKVAELTSERLLRASGVIRAIGSDAALDYFLAVAATSVVPTPPESPRGGGPSSSDTSVPVLTLLDIPKYDRYRPAALVALTAFFWWGVWQTGMLSLSTIPGRLELVAALGAWVAALVGAHLLTGVLAERSTEEFVRRRQRLLNEHGIRWHDCLSGDRQCPLCWSSARTHQDQRFDYGRFCRCPAC